LGIVIFLLRQVLKVIKLFWVYSTSSFYNFVNLIDICLALTIIVLWIQIVAFKGFKIEEDGTVENFVPLASALSTKQKYYLIFCSCNVLVSFVRIL